MFQLPAESFARVSAVHARLLGSENPEQIKQSNDGDRHSEQPQQNSFHATSRKLGLDRTARLAGRPD